MCVHSLAPPPHLSLTCSPVCPDPWSWLWQETGETGILGLSVERFLKLYVLFGGQGEMWGRAGGARRGQLFPNLSSSSSGLLSTETPGILSSAGSLWGLLGAWVATLLFMQNMQTRGLPESLCSLVCEWVLCLKLAIGYPYTCQPHSFAQYPWSTHTGPGVCCV